LTSLSDDGQRFAVGAHLNDGGGLNTGHVRIYDWNGTAWIQAGTDIDGQIVNGTFGSAVSLSGDGQRIAVGGAYSDLSIGTRAGLVKVFVWDGSNWVQEGGTLEGSASGILFGRSVSLSQTGETLIVGAPGLAGGGTYKGEAHIFTWDNLNWNSYGNPISGIAVDDQAGRDVAISADGQWVTVGADRNDGGFPDAGHVRVFALLDTLPADTLFQTQGTCDSTLAGTVSNLFDNDTLTILTFTQFPSYRDTIIDTLVQGDTLIFGGIPYTTGIQVTDTLSSTHGCDSLVTLILSVQTPNAIFDSLDTSLLFSLYPVPSNGNIYLEIQGPLLAIAPQPLFILYDTQGREVFTIRPKKRRTLLSLSYLAKGIYRMVMILEGQVQVETLVLK